MSSTNKQRLASLSVIFPAYNDSQSISKLVRKVYKLLPTITNDFEIIIVNDASLDNTAEILMRLQMGIPVRIITHTKNMGYGGAVANGLRHATKEFVFYTDGDGQYDVGELSLLVEKMDRHTDVVNGYKIKRNDPWYRIVIGKAFNTFTKMFLSLHIRDVDCDFRLIRASFLKNITLTKTSGAFCSELIKKLQANGAVFREIPIHHYPRKYGSSQFFQMGRIARTLLDVFSLRFSE